MEDRVFMRRALELAELGRGTTIPNPMVGCVIVHKGRIIGEGWHRQYGQAHAEVNAIDSVEDPSVLQQATVYVTLEPCVHHGRTPPCVDLLIRQKVRRVVMATVDSNPLVAGKGIQKLHDAGIEVQTGVLEEESRILNRRFFTSLEKNRPYIILKWAQTSDGYLAGADYNSKWISCPESRSLAHQWRAEEDAIMVGTHTARYDNPRLNVRDWSGTDPLRIVIDKKLTLDRSSLHLFGGSQPTLVFNGFVNQQYPNLDLIAVGSENYIDFILSELQNRKIQSLIIEGGAELLNTFIRRKLWDEARVFTAPVKFKEGIRAPKLECGSQLCEQVGVDLLNIFVNF